MALSIKAEEIVSIGDLVLTNSFLTSVIIFSVVSVLLTICTKSLSIKPNRVQIFLEIIIEKLYGLYKNILGNNLNGDKSLFYFVFTFFIFILTSNWFGLLPITGSVGIVYNAHNEESKNDGIRSTLVYNFADKSFRMEHAEVVPFFRSPSADINYTLSLALLAFLLIQISSIRALGLNYLGKFFDYRVKLDRGWKIILTPVKFIINFLWKTLELVLEFSKILSFAFRLFGNIFAGEVLLFVITSLTVGLLTLPFLGFEIFVGFIQSLIFVFLLLVFIRVNLESHGH